ncbi:hypothetical protein [Bacteriovorax sp. Seq25_V]|uniref:hypothetical protein n=1 Tax=Bacteriovorax sp. Seq25_V TaxID=1201288 RepID=UPI00038A4718|nr:hypothetical protein [Bacteriovorax sp. Seq25_V]EQC44326.1 hypothetical protein M900_A0480 [Bacteriovorax sp. Seq25_V]
MKEFLLSTMLIILTNAYAQDCSGLAGVYKCVPELDNIDSYELVISNTDGKMRFVSEPFDLTFGHEEIEIIEGTKGAITCADIDQAKMIVTVASQTPAKHADSGEEFMLEHETSVLSDIIKASNGDIQIINKMGTDPNLGYIETCTRI